MKKKNYKYQFRNKHHTEEFATVQYDLCYKHQILLQMRLASYAVPSDSVRPTLEPAMITCLNLRPRFPLLLHLSLNQNYYHGTE